MSLSGIALPISLFGSKSLAQVVSLFQPKLPLFCSLSADTLSIENSCQLNLDASETALLHEQAFNELAIRTKDIEAGKKTEFVVFSSITLTQLATCVSNAGVAILSLAAINHRQGQTSIRFNVQCEDIAQSRQAIAEFSQEQNIELALIENAPSLAEPGLLVMDMDSTTIEIECIDEIAALAGVGEQVAQVTELAMQGKLDFAQSLHQRVATLKDASERVLHQVADDIPLMAGLTPLVEQLKTHNWKIAIASGGFTYFADHLKDVLGLDAAVANTLEIVDGKLTGKVLGDVIDAQVKADTLQTLQAQFNLPHAQTVAMGDGANDLLMMNAASLGVAYHAKPIVTQQATCAINHQGLDVLLHWLR